MKLIFILMIVFSASAFAADKSSGCGMGWRVTKSMTTSGSSTRATTNGTFSSTFAMTSGTSGCAHHSIVFDDKMRIHFIESNLQPLQYEIAAGRGERLEIASMVFGCNQESLPRFIDVLRTRGGQLLVEKSPEAMMGGIKSLITTDTELKTACLI